jgi:prepilin-type N-terminal cleavage/methylation domain-containing protein
MRQQSGFTLIELVIVIVILGLLAATALPRFADLTDDATEAAFNGVRGGFRSAVAITHAQWLVDSSPATITLEGQTIPMNASGWPYIDGATFTNGTDLFNGLLNEDFASLADWSTDNGSPTTQYTLTKSITCAFSYTATDGSVAVVGTCP